MHSKSPREVSSMKPYIAIPAFNSNIKLQSFSKKLEQLNLMGEISLVVLM